MSIVWIIVILAVVVGLIVIANKKKTPKNVFSSDFDFSKRLDEAQKNRNFLVTQAKTDADDYGYTLNNPIMESTINTSYAFLDRLRTADGKPITYNRVGSICLEIGGQTTMVDRYTLFVDGQEYKTLFVCPYGHSLGIAPKGLSLASKN